MNRVIVMGGSAGGFDAALQIVSDLEPEFPAALFIVLHLGEGPGAALRRRLDEASALPVTFALDGEAIAAAHVYFAPPDRHLFLDGDHIRLTHGPRVNRSRPAIDLTFRSAAVNYGPRAVGVVLSGMLDDGSAGLAAIAQCGGQAIVQHPADAQFPQMPQNALTRVNDAEITPVSVIGPLLNRMAQSAVPVRELAAQRIPEHLIVENQLDLEMMDDMEHMEEIGKPAPLSCPECNGPLWEIKGEGPPRYRCHVGHSLNAQSMLAGQDEGIEQTLWAAVRALEEKTRVQRRLAAWESEAGRQKVAAGFETSAREAQQHARRLRGMLLELVGEERLQVGGELEPAADNENNQ